MYFEVLESLSGRNNFILNLIIIIIFKSYFSGVVGAFASLIMVRTIFILCSEINISFNRISVMILLLVNLLKNLFDLFL